MTCRTWRFPYLLITAYFLLFLLAVPSAAMNDPDPNSPSPVLLRAKDSKRVRAIQVKDPENFNSDAPSGSAFSPGSLIAVFVTSVSLIEGEGASAFRIYGEDSQGRQYRFPIIGLRQVENTVKTQPRTYALIFKLTDEIGYWQTPANGDILIRVAWRGMTSDRARLGFGTTGGTIKDDAVPFSQLLAGSEIKEFVDDEEISSPQYVGYRWSGDRMRFLQQAAFGPTPALDTRIRRLGLRIWLEEQLNAPYPSAYPYPEMPLKPSNAPADCDGDDSVPDVPVNCRRDTYTMYPVQAWFFKEAYYGDAQLRHRVSWALSQIWVVSGADTQQSRWLTEYYKVLANNAFGNYRTLMREMTLNPAMGNYLDMARSTRNNPNENYAREIMQLFTVGLFMLNPDGTLKLDLNGSPIPTYDQDDVNDLTKVFTGWRFCNTQASCPNAAPGVVNYIDPLELNSANHNLTAKTLLSYPGVTTDSIPACTGCTGTLRNTYALNSMDQAIDNLFYHPNTGPFVSKLLIQHLVTSDPTAAYVERVTNKFNNNGMGERGDMKAVIRAILLDPEARGDVKTDPNFGKLREPVQLATNIGRAFNVRSADGASASDGVFYSQTNNLISRMGQPFFYSPTVFNYYSPDYVIPGTTMLGPEFNILTTGTTIARANFFNTMVYSRVSVSQPNVPAGTSLDLSEMQALAAADTSGNRLLDALNFKMMQGNMSPSMRARILTAVTSIQQSNSLARAQQAVYLIATSSQYQIQR